jgi:uncharacterized membrane protein YqjE
MTESSSRSGLFASLRGLAATGLALLQTRLELLAVELQEEKLRLANVAAFGTAAVIFLAAGIVFLAIFLTVLFWDSNRLLALGVFTTLFLGGGFVCLLVARRHAQTPSGLFAASLAELVKDRAAAEAEAESGTK